MLPDLKIGRITLGYVTIDRATGVTKKPLFELALRWLSEPLRRFETRERSMALGCGGACEEAWACDRGL